MSSSKPGRNDPCPCGSGKKYKACHAAEDRARAAPPPAPLHPLASELQAAMALLGDPDVSKLSRALDQLGSTLASWGPAPGLRFEASAFDAHITQALGALPDTVEQDACPGPPRAVRRHRDCSSAPASSSMRMRAALLQRAAESGRVPEERQALCVGALLASAPRKSDSLPARGHPRAGGRLRRAVPRVVRAAPRARRQVRGARPRLRGHGALSRGSRGPAPGPRGQRGRAPPARSVRSRASSSASPARPRSAPPASRPSCASPPPRPSSPRRRSCGSPASSGSPCAP